MKAINVMKALSTPTPAKAINLPSRHEDVLSLPDPHAVRFEGEFSNYSDAWRRVIRLGFTPDDEGVDFYISEHVWPTGYEDGGEDCTFSLYVYTSEV